MFSEDAHLIVSRDLPETDPRLEEALELERRARALREQVLAERRERALEEQYRAGVPAEILSPTPAELPTDFLPYSEDHWHLRFIVAAGDSQFGLSREQVAHRLGTPVRGVALRAKKLIDRGLVELDELASYQLTASGRTLLDRERSQGQFEDEARILSGEGQFGYFVAEGLASGAEEILFEEMGGKWITPREPEAQAHAIRECAKRLEDADPTDRRWAEVRRGRWQLDGGELRFETDNTYVPRRYWGSAAGLAGWASHYPLEGSYLATGIDGEPANCDTARRLLEEGSVGMPPAV